MAVKRRKINRSPLPHEVLHCWALIIRYKKPFIEWAKYPGSEDDFEYNPKTTPPRIVLLDYKLPKSKSKKEKNTYSIYKEITGENGKAARDKILKEHYKQIFESELHDWEDDTKGWPKKRSYKMFKKWFHIEFSNMVWNATGQPIRNYFR